MMTSLVTELLLLFFLWYSMICLTCSIPSEYSIVGDDFDKFTSEEEVLGAFKMWQKEYEREYQNPEEEAKRFEIFKSNLKYVRETNVKRRSTYHYRLGLNKFADLSYEEFSETYLPKMEEPITEDEPRSDMELNNKSFENAPASIDWRKKGAVTRVKNQRRCGSCWAFSATGAMEGINAIKTGTLVSLSEQELMDCSNPGRACRGGWYFKAFDWVVKNDGIAKEADYPYTGTNGLCNSTKPQKKAVTIDGYQRLPRGPQSENSLFLATSQQPVSVALKASRDFQLYNGGIYHGLPNCSNSCNDINHAVLIVGYDSLGGEDYWIIKNSWGEGWGGPLKGYMWIKRNTGDNRGLCSINCWGSYPTKEKSATKLVKRDYSSI